MIFSTYGTSLYPDTPREFFLSSTIFAIICDLSPSPFGAENIYFFLFDSKLEGESSNQYEFTRNEKKRKGTSFRANTLYFLEKEKMPLFRFFLLHFSVTRASSRTSFTFSPRRLFLNPTCRFFMTLSQFHPPHPPSFRSPFENFGSTPGVPPLSLSLPSSPPPILLPHPFATPRNNLKAH